MELLEPETHCCARFSIKSIICCRNIPPLSFYKYMKGVSFLVCWVKNKLYTSTKIKEEYPPYWFNAFSISVLTVSSLSTLKASSSVALDSFPAIILIAQAAVARIIGRES